MATLTKYDNWVVDVAAGNHVALLTAAGGDVLKVSLSATAPDASDTNLASASEISYANSDWSAGGEDATKVTTVSGGTILMSTTDVTIIASGDVATFAYVILHNATQDLLIGYYPIGSTVSLTNGQSFKTDFEANLLTMT